MSNAPNNALGNFHTLYMLWALIFIGLVYVIFLRKRSTRQQKILVLLLGLLPLFIYFIYTLMHFSLISGPNLNLGVFKFTYAYSDSLPWLLAVVMPVIVVILLIIKSRNWSWKKRIMLPLFVGIVISAICTFALIHIYQIRGDIDPGINCNDECPLYTMPRTSQRQTDTGTPKIVTKTYCSDLCPQNTRTFQIYEGVNSKVECEKIKGQTILDIAWGGFIGCRLRQSDMPSVVRE